MFANNLTTILKGNVCEYAILATTEIEFSEAVVNACKMNYCGKYNTCWTCPPAVGKLEDLKAKYSKFDSAFVFTTKHSIEDSFDIEGMFDAKVEHEKVEQLILDIVKKNDCKLLGAGGCNICEKCTFPNLPCRFPDRAKPSVEACGIDVVDLAKKCNIKYHNGVNTVTYFSVVFYNK